MDGHDIFCPKCDLSLLTSRLPALKFSRSWFEKEDGNRKELVDIATLDLIEAIQLDMDRYIESKCSPNELYDCSYPNNA